MWAIPMLRDLFDLEKTLNVDSSGLYMLDKGVRVLRPTFEPGHLLRVIASAEIVLEDFEIILNRYPHFWEGK